MLYCVIFIHYATSITWLNTILSVSILLPVCLWIIVALHELSHLICFRIFGFKVKELRIGLLLFRFNKGGLKITFVGPSIFRGFCTVERVPHNSKTKLIIALVAGGTSGLLVSLTSLGILTLNIIPEGWKNFLILLSCIGLYSFYATLLSPKSADGQFIRKIIKEEFIK